MYMGKFPSSSSSAHRYNNDYDITTIFRIRTLRVRRFDSRPAFRIAALTRAALTRAALTSTSLISAALSRVSLLGGVLSNVI